MPLAVGAMNYCSTRSSQTSKKKRTRIFQTMYCQLILTKKKKMTTILSSLITVLMKIFRTLMTTISKIIMIRMPTDLTKSNNQRVQIIQWKIKIVKTAMKQTNHQKKVMNKTMQRSLMKTG